MPSNNGRNNEVSGWTGWVYFAGLMMVVSGIFQIIAGLTALLRQSFFLVTPSHIVAFDYTTWGWIHLILGIVVVSAGSAVVNGRTWGRVLGVILATLSAIANFAFISAYPFWSITIMVVDALIIYALIVHGREAAE